MKQMLLNNNDHRVAELRKPKNEAEASLLLNYFKATDLNKFFGELSNDDLSKFYTIQFSELISLHKKVFGSSLEPEETLKSELELLQNLRNDETHFMIRHGSFLSEENFRVLHNFMVRFYKIIKTWWPKDRNDLESSIYLWWDWFCPDKGDNTYEFECKPLRNFSYESAVRNSKLAKDIAEILKGNCQCGAPDFSPYTIAVDLVNGYNGLPVQFDEVWTMVYMMQSFRMIVVDEIQDTQGTMHCAMRVLF